jgi:hypothetical protein
MSSKEIIYILGAGRSGSTILATVLHDHEKVQNVGELHHFFSYLKNDERCSCGAKLSNCEFWGAVKDKLPVALDNDAAEYEQLAHRMEYHSVIPFYLLGTEPIKNFQKYKEAQEQIIQVLDDSKDGYILDSAKYIGRFMALRKIFNNDVKGIFLVRDLRGVIWSFKKKVQTQSPPLRTVIYYTLINTLGQMLSWFLPSEQIMKVRYEDIVDRPEETFTNIGNFLELDYSEAISKIKAKRPFNITHIVGGNRLKTSNKVVLRKDDKWQKNMPALQKIGYYLLAWPLMLINKYKILK